MIVFTDDCLIGIEQLDKEHRYLFELLQRLQNLLADDYLSDRYTPLSEIITDLDFYAEQHFAHEEDYMMQIRDPELIRQRAQHEYFREKVHELNVANIDEDEHQRAVLEDTARFLTRWLYHHIIGSDILIGKLPPLDEWMLKENPCEFTDEYLTGIELIDAEHKELFLIIDEAYQLLKTTISVNDFDKIMHILDRLKDYTVHHFQDEEEYMESISYEGLAAQKKAHAAFIDRLEHIDLNKEEVEDNPQEYMQGLVEFLLGWLVNHILHTDRKIPCR